MNAALKYRTNETAEPGLQPGLRESWSSLEPGARPSIAILGVPLDNVTTEEAIQEIDRMVGSQKSHYIVTANVDFLVQARNDVELRSILLEADLVLCDGTPLLWASQLLGNPLPERVAGADLTPLLIRYAEQKRFRLFFLGASPESLEQAVANLKRDHPDLVIAGHYSPPFRNLLEMDHDEIRRRIQAAKPDILFVAFGCPKQEKWISMNYRQLGVPVSIGVGATIDFLARRIARAPRWMQRCGLEWTFRLAQEPRRLFRRYFTDVWVFGSTVLAQLWRLRLRPRKRGRGPARTPFLVDPYWQCFKPPDHLVVSASRDCARLASEILADKRHCLIDLQDISFIDSTGISFLARLQKQLRDAGARLVLLNPSPVVHCALNLLRLTPFFLVAPDVGAARQLLATIDAEQAEIVTLRPLGSNEVLRWQGEITADNIEEVWSRTSAHLAQAALCGAALIDLSAVRFIDSSGLGLMIRARKLAANQGTDLRFEGAPPTVRNVIRIARLDAFLLGRTHR